MASDWADERARAWGQDWDLTSETCIDLAAELRAAYERGVDEERAAIVADMRASADLGEQVSGGTEVEQAVRPVIARGIRLVADYYERGGHVTPKAHTP